MRKSNEVKRLAEALAGLATVITEIIDARVQSASIKAALPQTVHLTAASKPSDPWMTQKQVAAQLQISRKTLYNWTAKGFLPSYKVGRSVRYRMSDVQKSWEAKFKRYSFD
jgi:excisionase family DNA binding protein